MAKASAAPRHRGPAAGIRSLVAADLVVLAVQAAGADPGHAGVQDGTAALGAGANVQLDLAALDADHVLDQCPALLAGQGRQRLRRWVVARLSTISTALALPVWVRPSVSLAATTATTPRPSRRTPWNSP